MDLPNSMLMLAGGGVRYYPLAWTGLGPRRLLRLMAGLYYQGMGPSADDTAKRSCPGWTNCTEMHTGYVASYYAHGIGLGIGLRYDVLFGDWSGTAGKVNFWSFHLEARYIHDFWVALNAKWNDPQVFKFGAGPSAPIVDPPEYYVWATPEEKQFDISGDQMFVDYIALLLSTSIHF